MNEQEIYLRLFKKMTNYSNSEFPITDFLNDIKLNTQKNFNKEAAYEGLEKIFDTFMLFYNDSNKYMPIKELMQRYSISNIKELEKILAEYKANK